MLTLQEAARLVQARYVGADEDSSRVFNRVTTDSRDILPGDLFIALRGEKFDGHDFIEQARQCGAVAVMVETLPTDFSGTALVVENTRRALGQLAAGWRARFTIPVIAVTGSNGKTTVKEMIAAILAAAYGEQGRLATRGNLNNDIGVPLTLLRLRKEHQAAVVELGMNHPGEIALLARITQPTVALVNNAQREHQEFMQSVEAVAQENGAVLTALPQEGVAVFPADSPHAVLWHELAAGRRVLNFAGSRTTDAKLGVLGEHNLRNAEAAAACARAIGLSDAVIVRGLEAFQPVAGRLVVKQGAQGNVVIDDTYNANPDSVRAAIDVLATFAPPTLLILGDMGEVGDQSEAFHAEVGAYALERGVSHLIAVGQASAHAARAYGPRAQHYATVEEALGGMSRAVQGISILVKGSRFMRMERIVTYFLGEAHAA